MNLQFYIDELQKIHTDKCICITDAELEKPGPHILWANSCMEKLTGYNLEELKSQTPRVLQGTKTDRRTLDRLKETLKKGEVFEGAILNYRKDGSPFCKAWRIAPIFEDGKVVLFVSVHEGIATLDAEDYISAMKRIVDLQKGILEKIEAHSAKA